ncbi:MAG: hypothetical protein JWN46_1972 [Acidimicrobiales bacterium]|nr:hypothetical protein [Acidimicrobiales bacterium]
MEAWEAVAREGVRDTLARYTHAGDRGRAGDLAACFTEDGVLDVGDAGGRWVGRAAIAAQIDAVIARGAASRGNGATPGRHHVSSVLIDLESAAEASSSSYFLVLTGDGSDHWGRYRDRLRVEDGRWLLVERIVRVDGRTPAPRVPRT